MGLFERRKKNGDYFTQIITGITSLQKDTEFHKEKLTDIKTDFSEHKTAEYERRKIDREWQKCVDGKLQELKTVKCIKEEQLGNMQDDVDTLKTDKVTRDGKFLGIKSVYAVILGVLGFVTLVLGILWRLGYL